MGSKEGIPFWRAFPLDRRPSPRVSLAAADMANTPDELLAPQAPSYKGLEPASERSSAAARGSSRKADTRCEIKLRSVLWQAGARFRKNVKSLPGKPDIVFPGPGLAVFCDGDFWHGRNWEDRRRKLSKGTNAGYWTAKIRRNRQRDRETTARLEADGWRVLRFWESEIDDDVEAVARKILATLETVDTSSKKA